MMMKKIKIKINVNSNENIKSKAESKKNRSPSAARSKQREANPLSFNPKQPMFTILHNAMADKTLQDWSNNSYIIPQRNLRIT